jgi:histidine triad (HIT) family protein
VFDVARQVAGAMERALDADGFNLFQANGEAAGQEVFHSHVHVVPRKADDGIDLGWEQGDLDEATAESLRSAVREEL